MALPYAIDFALSGHFPRHFLLFDFNNTRYQ
jgi:hypothetical protein